MISYLIVIIKLYKFDCIIALVSYNLKWLSDPKPVDTQCFGGFQCFTHVISYKLFMYCNVIYIHVTVFMSIFQVNNCWSKCVFEYLYVRVIVILYLV